MSILVPVCSVISRITLPPVPITSRILSFGIWNCVMRGAVAATLVTRAAQTLGHLAQDMDAAVLRLAQSDLHDLLP